MFITITGDSCSWKSSLWEELIKRNWKSPYNYTTRPPRDDSELDSYVFISEALYKEKKDRGEFAVVTSQYGYNYAMSKIMPEGNVFVIIDESGRDSYRESWENWEMFVKSFASFFLSIDEALQKLRLEKRNEDEETINKRLATSFSPTASCLILNWADTVEETADIIEESLWV